jgi:predicted nicotinamide N-methyase
LQAQGLPPPFWAFAWAGGQALARHLLDHPEQVAGRRVVDLASGSGLVAIAAAKAGAAQVTAVDIDAFAIEAIGLNAALNGVAVEAFSGDLIGGALDADVLLVGDLFYERDLAARLFDWLVDLDARGVAVLIGDPGRTYLPTDRLVEVARHAVPVSRALEDAEIKNGRVWRIAETSVRPS